MIFKYNTFERKYTMKDYFEEVNLFQKVYFTLFFNIVAQFVYIFVIPLKQFRCIVLIKNCHLLRQPRFHWYFHVVIIILTVATEVLFLVEKQMKITRLKIGRVRFVFYSFLATTVQQIVSLTCSVKSCNVVKNSFTFVCIPLFFYLNRCA